MDYDQINRNYRNSDISRWQSLNFIVGYEIKRSNNSNSNCDICSLFIGKYPKTFNWSGWHDGCKCVVTPIMMDREEISLDEQNELKSAIKGIEYKKIESVNTVKYVPKNFMLWYAKNIESMLSTNVIPDFVSNNIDLIRLSFEHYKNKNGNSKS